MRILPMTLLALSTMLVSINTHAATTESNRRQDQRTGQKTKIRESVREGIRESFYIDIKGGTSKPEALKGSFKQSKLRHSGVMEVRTGYNFDPFSSDLAIAIGHHYKLNSHSVGVQENVEGFDFTHRAKVRFTAVTVNGYYNLGKFNVMTPYIGLGAGFTHNRFGDTNVTFARDGQDVPFKNKKGTASDNFVWQAMAGVRFTLTPDLELSLEYKYMDLGTVKTSDRYQITNNDYIMPGTDPWRQDNIAKGKLRSNNLLIGLRYYF